MGKREPIFPVLLTEETIYMQKKNWPFSYTVQVVAVFQSPVVSNSATSWTAACHASRPHHLPEFAQVHVHCISDAMCIEST